MVHASYSDERAVTPLNIRQVNKTRKSTVNAEIFGNCTFRYADVAVDKFFQVLLSLLVLIPSAVGFCLGDCVYVIVQTAGRNKLDQLNEEMQLAYCTRMCTVQPSASAWL